MLIAIMFRNRDDDGVGEKPVIEVFNHTPFHYKNRNFTSVNGQKMFEIFNSENSDKGPYIYCN